MPSFLEIAVELVAGPVTEVLPISGGGHAALAAMLFDLTPDLHVQLACSLGLLLGTLGFLYPAVVGLVRGGARVAPSKPRSSGPVAPSEQGDRVLVAAGTVAVVAAALAVRANVASWSHEPVLVGASLLISAAVLVGTFWAPEGDRDAPTTAGAILVGAVQGGALLPGLSGSALALAALLWLGVRRRRAFELCFLMVIPAEAVLLGRYLPGVHTPRLFARGFVDVAWTGVATLLALFVTTLALRVVRGAVLRGWLPLFALYLVPLAVATLAWSYARP